MIRQRLSHLRGSAYRRRCEKDCPPPHDLACLRVSHFGFPPRSLCGPNFRWRGRVPSRPARFLSACPFQRDTTIPVASPMRCENAGVSCLLGALSHRTRAAIATTECGYPHAACRTFAALVYRWRGTPSFYTPEAHIAGVAKHSTISDLCVSARDNGCW